MSTIITHRQFPNYHKYEMELAGRPLTLEVGKLAELANAAVMVGYGDTRVLVCATASARPRDGIDFFPLSVDFEEKLYSVGRIPGSFNRREGRPGEKGILTSRVIDRPIRPLFPSDFRNDVSIMATVMSVDHDCSPEIAALIGTSAALAISDIPWNGPVGALKVGLVNGELVLNPNSEQRKVSDLDVTVVSSNGSTSQGSICGSTLALMDAGVPIKAPVAGISCGLIQDGDDFTTFIDIQGVEDFHGEMDFKVAGTKKGITAIQMDLKNDGLTMAIIKNALEITYDARVQILDQIMLPCISEPRAEVSQYAPKMITMHIDPERIREVIGKGGSVIQKIVADTGAKVDIDDDGTIHIASANAAACDAAKKCIDDIVFVPEVGKLYYGRVVRLMQFGAFVEIAPGKDGLVHISKLDRKRVEKVEDVVTVGDMIWVKFMEIDEKGRWNLSRKDALIEIEAQQAAAKAAEQQ